MSHEEASYDDAPAAPEKNSSAGEKDLCRDFKKGDCRRREKCIYNHPELEVCRDYQLRECTRHDCRFVHVTKEEEEAYDGSGMLPSHVHNGPFTNDAPKSRGGNNGGYNSMLGKRSYNAMSSMPPMPSYGQDQNSTDLCGDFRRGDCRRGSRCKFYHPRLVICRDFQKDKCNRDSCRFLHMTQEEEKTYEGNGIVPDHIDKEKLKNNQIMLESREGGGRGMGDMYGKRRPDAYGMAAPVQSGGYSMPLEAALQENATLKIKLSEMQQQITDLRKMNDILYEQNNSYRNQSSFN